ncbi:aminotransferase class I/II-fold pyridoxal phosphate-dependent enzyme [Streptomyces sp. NBC_00885]|uniref:pyridoxal phosphate-dependent aminotransferase n=1 Tax=Streptomyces sp. NBC_00885 TaxID=2975857 RepID=UPI00386A30B2|nr:aminotransferase class I/II-fold pyridoxal phosphate-dependent enzyme [Streptomyces sp. NBC_00885]
MSRNLTERQVSVLSDEFNLADGHAYRKWNAAEQAILDTTPAMFRQLDRRQQSAIESTYFETFFSLAQQMLNTSHFERFPCFTASGGIEIIANYLRLNNLSATLIEPCFDNLKDILKRHQIPLSPFPDDLLEAEGEVLDAFLAQMTTDVLFIVSPNNPTGATAGKENFARIVDFCARQNKTLILDACFRFYLPDGEVYDQYAMLADADVDCIVIEDTGKTWPTLELKGPFISVSDRLIDPIAHINSDFLLHVSPFAIGLMTDFLNLSIADNRGHFRAVAAENRATLYVELAPTFLQPVERPYMSVSWLKINADIPAVTLTELLGKEGVYVLPGNQFFWTDQALGDTYLRVALMRDPKMFKQAAACLSEALQRLAVPAAS